MTDKLVQLRKKNGLSQLELAEKLNVSRQAISKWEVGSTIPSTDNIKKLSNMYHVPLSYLMHDSEEILHSQTYSDHCSLLNSDIMRIVRIHNCVVLYLPGRNTKGCEDRRYRRRSI